uniref:Portal protein n=1 Tax=Pseudomonas phage Nican01 TaxID=3138540 RepID=A0AAU6W100_9CAUD
MPIDSKQAKAIVDRKHPLFEELVPHWCFMEASYKGGRGWFESNIFRYIKEGDREYKDRVDRAYRFNHTRETVDLVNKYLFRAPINRKTADAPAAVQKFWKKVDSTGLDIDEFMRVVSLKQSIFGRPWIVIDNRVTAEDVPDNASKADVPEPELYAYLVPPQQVPDYAFDEAGELLWVLIEEHVRDDADPINGTGALSCRYRLWTREEWILIEFKKNPKKKDGGNWEQTGYGKHDLGLVPVIPANNSIGSDKWDCPALIADVAYLDRAVSNYASNLDAIIQDQAFSQLAMPAQGVLPGDDAYNKVLEMGTKRVFLYDGEAGNAPVFLSPDPRQATLILSAIGQLINEIYHSVGLAGERTKQDNSQGIDNSSGVAKTKDFERVVALLSAKADALEVVEYKMMQIIAAWAGEALPEDANLVTYPVESQFDVRTMYDELDTAMKLRLMGLPAGVMEEQVNRLVTKLFPDLADDMIKKLRAEVKEWSTEPTEQEKAAQAAGTGSETSKRVVEEAKRNRADASTKKSDTQSRETGKTNG